MPAHISREIASRYNMNQSSAASFKGCCCCLFLFFSLIGLLLLAALLVIILAVKPKKPHFDLQQVGVQYVGINPNPSLSNSASITFNIRLLFVAENNNKVGIKYGDSTFIIAYHGIPIGRGIVPGFYQPPHTVRRVATTVAVDRVNLMQGYAVDLINDASMRDRVELGVMGDIGAKIRVLGVYSPRVQVAVDCTIVISPRKQSLSYKQCEFNGVTV